MSDRRVVWFRAVVDVKNEEIVQPWLATTHQMFEACLESTVSATGGMVEIVDLEGGQSFGVREVDTPDREDV